MWVHYLPHTTHRRLQSMLTLLHVSHGPCVCDVTHPYLSVWGMTRLYVWRVQECEGTSICRHKREKHTCRECGGSGICVHNKRKARCKECGGKVIVCVCVNVCVSVCVLVCVYIHASTAHADATVKMVR